MCQSKNKNKMCKTVKDLEMENHAPMQHFVDCECDESGNFFLLSKLGIKKKKSSFVFANFFIFCFIVCFFSIPIICLKIK